jgi:hypothetical protein
MKNKKVEALIILLSGVLVLFFSWFVFEVYEPVSNTDSPRLKDLNRLIHAIGKVPATILFAGIGFLFCSIAIKKFRK